jgi:soluble lytic murein transglycosylase-like protein
VGLALLAGPAAARTVAVPLALDAPFLRRQLEARIFTEDGAAGVRGPDRCSEARLALPDVAFEPGRVLLTSEARARVGVALGDRCLGLRDRAGVLAVAEEPWLEPRRARVRFRVVDSRLAPSGESWLPYERLWGWVGPALHPRLEAFAVDLEPLLEDLRLLLPLFAPPSAQDAAERLAASLELARVEVRPEGVAVALQLEVGEGAAPPRTPEPPLSAAEAAALRREARRLDAFLTFVVKQAGRDAPASAHRRELLAVLLDARHALLDALAEEGDPGGPDPVRALFVATWARLAPVLRALDDELPAEGGLRYLAFVAAGDALAALDAAGPAVGLELSRDGLRRLARTLAPAAREDPLARPRGVDPELRALFGFGAPLPPPVPPEADEGGPDASAPPDASPPDGAPAPEAPPAGDAAAPGPPVERPAVPPPPGSESTPVAPPGSEPPAPQPPAEPPTAPALPPPEGALRGLERLARGLGALLSAPAHAAEAPAGDASLRLLARRLNAWAPSPADAHEYLPLAGRLLRRVAEDAHAESPLPGQRVAFFRALVLATGWQESCWRQFVRRGGALTPLRSSAGAVGIMQVSERVWRGFYDVEGLRRDVAYNGRAGSEILLHYLRDFALPREREVGDARALARAGYAMYHGGPGHVLRWRDPKTAPALKAIDAAFLRKYDSLEAGDERAVLSCFAG